MEDWTKYLDGSAPESQEEAETPKEVAAEEPEVLTLAKIREFCGRLSGKDGQGVSKAVISYQAYDSGFSMDTTNDKNAEIIYNCSKAYAELSFDALNPDLVLLSITFPSYDDPELRLFWARLQKWVRRNSGAEQITDDTVPVFYIHLFERGSVSARTDVQENILEAGIVNPLICYLTRELPAVPAAETTNKNGEVMGGNVVKMLCNMQFVTFSVIEDADTSRIKAEVLRDVEDARYLAAEEESGGASAGFNLN